MLEGELAKTLTKCWCVDVPNREGKRQHRFDVVTRDSAEKVELAAESDAEKRRWIGLIGELYSASSTGKAVCTHLIRSCSGLDVEDSNDALIQKVARQTADGADTAEQEEEEGFLSDLGRKFSHAVADLTLPSVQEAEASACTSPHQAADATSPSRVAQVSDAQRRLQARVAKFKAKRAQLEAGDGAGGVGSAA